MDRQFHRGSDIYCLGGTMYSVAMKERPWNHLVCANVFFFYCDIEIHYKLTRQICRNDQLSIDMLYALVVQP